MDAFKVGEVVVWQNVDGALAWLNGCETTITGPLMMRKAKSLGEVLCYLTDTDATLMGVSLIAAKPSQLRKKRPPATGLESILALFKPMPQREGVAA
jgi:hypothetical protein